MVWQDKKLLDCDWSMDQICEIVKYQNDKVLVVADFFQTIFFFGDFRSKKDISTI